MKKNTLESRVAALERELAALKELLIKGSTTADWRQTVGMFAGDATTKEVLEEAMKLREKDRAKARRRFARQRANS